MQESKYFYDGIPLSKYCKDNGINANTIRTRIWKKKQSKQYENYTEQEIVNMVVEAYGSSIKYMYKGMTLRRYCISNGICYETINSRIMELKKKNKDCTNEELVILAMEEFKNQNFKFFYEGVPLKEYCESHPDIHYQTIRMYIQTEKKKHPELTEEELIEQYIRKEHKGIYTYYYLGIPLKQYCEENHFNYRNIISYMCRCRKQESFQNLSDDEFVEAIMDHYQPFQPKYLYQGMTLREYCKENDLSYYSVVTFVKRKRARGNTKSVDELIHEGISTINRYGFIYYYKGVPLKEYAEQNNLNVHSIRCAILRKRAKSDRPLQEIIDECVETYQKFSIKYLYHGESLLTFCRKVGLNYNTVIHKYLDEFKDYTNLSVEDAINQIVEDYLENPPMRTKYYVNDLSLAKFCDRNGYSYAAIWGRIRTLQNKGNALDDKQMIEMAIQKYETRLHINQINDIFRRLESIEIQDHDELKKICEFLKINFENVLELIDMEFSCSQAVNLIWYFGDREDYNGFKIITDKKLNDLFLLIHNIKTSSKSDIQNFELYDLIGIYKSGLYDSRNEILIRQKNFIFHTIYSLCREYNIEVNRDNLEDFESEIKLYLITLIDCTYVNIYGQMVKYMDLTVKGSFRRYLKAYQRQNNMLSLDDTKYSKDRGTKKAKKLIDSVADSSSPSPQLEDSSFSSTMMQVLSTLPKQDVLFIVLKFQENYTNSELAEYFKMSEEEVRTNELRILSLLKDSPSIKVLKKIK